MRVSGSNRKFVTVLAVVAALMLVLMLLPPSLWKHPANDLSITGFDPNLLYVNDPAGVHITPSTITWAPKRDVIPAVTFLTTSLPSFEVSFDVTITAIDAEGAPLRIGIWSPSTGTGHFIVFEASPDRSVVAESVRAGSVGPSLVGGEVTDVVPLGNYVVGSVSRVVLALDRAHAYVTARIERSNPTSTETFSAQARLLAAFGNLAVSVTASAPSTAASGSMTAIMRNYALTLPHQTFWTTKVLDVAATAAIVLADTIGCLLLLLMVPWRHLLGAPTNFARHVARLLSQQHIRHWRVATAVVASILAYLAGNALLFRLGGHPYDMGNEIAYSYVAITYGVDQLYYLVNVVTLARIWGGIPYAGAAFPYEPAMAYVFGADGALARLIAPGTPLTNQSLEYAIKSVNILFGLADSALIYAILLELNQRRRQALIGAVAFMFNPAVWFSMSVWGQTHVFSLFLVLATVLMIEKNHPYWAWVTLGLACLTRPQMIVFGALLGIVLIQKFPWGNSVSGLSMAVVTIFLALTPILIVVGPSVPVDVLLNNFRIQELSGTGVALITVSQGGYSIWPLLVYVTTGASGLARMFTPGTVLLAGPVSFLAASQAVTLVSIIAIALSLVLRRRAGSVDGSYLPFVALGIASFAMLTTGIVATHFLLALPFILLLRRWTGALTYAAMITAWTVTSLVGMYGTMGLSISPEAYPLLSPAHNAITRFVVNLYSWDRFITVGIVANLLVVAGLAYAAFRSKPADRINATPRSATEPI